MNIPMTMREAIDARRYFHVAIPHWASGGLDCIADSPASAALIVGCSCANFTRPPALHAQVSRHLPSSSIGCAVLEPLGVFQTLPNDNFSI